MQHTALVRGFVSAELVARGMVAETSYHAGHSGPDGKAQPHVHILLTMRRVEAEGFAAKKEREWNDRSLIFYLREAWAAHVNAALEAAGVTDERVDHRSLAARHAEAEERAAEARARGDEEAALEHEADAHELDRSPEPALGARS